MTLRITHRRLNILQAYLILDREWVTSSDLSGAGAYGEERSIRGAVLKMQKHRAVELRKGTRFFRFTPSGKLALGKIPAKMGDQNE